MLFMLVCLFYVFTSWLLSVFACEHDCRSSFQGGDFMCVSRIRLREWLQNFRSTLKFLRQISVLKKTIKGIRMKHRFCTPGSSRVCRSFFVACAALFATVLQNSSIRKPFCQRRMESLRCRCVLSYEGIRLRVRVPLFATHYRAHTSSAPSVANCCTFLSTGHRCL